ncbi:phage integrase N-terminal domain-containing protein [Fangia hongkongensis]|uniref:phage integrase N-terminal domain-containing protein n=1 Tax=Fangia hongkongensis TaxID=270495 RepID=UPI0003755A33|nr:phage integrase N-terminal domain-containing protein [Fangia hongkongensis]MBK2124431.1 integrase domain-containing protein [Fangia hongkongensis]
MSRALNDLNHSIHKLLEREQKTMSYSTRYARLSRLKLIACELHDMGYKLRTIGRIQPKHIYKLLEYWQDKELSVGRIKNLMSDLRFVFTLMEKEHLIKSNQAYGIGQRSYIATHDRAIDSIDFTGVLYEHLRCSFELQKHFGLRKEECLKIIPSRADKEKRIWLQGSWTKGGRERYIPILTKEQRYWLDRSRKVAGYNKSLIPLHKNYKEQTQLYDHIVTQNGWSNLHGLRHAYAQRRYTELSGFLSPIKGGEKPIMDHENKRIDLNAREVVSLELGHSRPEILASYIGSW